MGTLSIIKGARVPITTKLYTIYSPAHHKDGIVRNTKEEAEKDAPEFDGKTSE